MRISAKMIKNYVNVNAFEYSNQWSIRAGDPNTLYFQLVDLDRDGMRHIPTPAPIGVSVIFPSIDTAQVITSVASQPDALDTSVFKIDLSASQIPNSGNVRFEFTEGTTIRRFNILNGIAVEFPMNDGSC